MTDKTLAELIKDLDSATLAVKVADAAESEARSAANDARNRLNAAQKAVDRAVTEMKAQAPWNSDWHNARNAAVRATP